MARTWHGLIELTLAIEVAIQTGTASACGVCVIPCEQGRKKESSDSKPKFRHKHLRSCRWLLAPVVILVVWKQFLCLNLVEVSSTRVEFGQDYRLRNWMPLVIINC